MPEFEVGDWVRRKSHRQDDTNGPYYAGEPFQVSKFRGGYVLDPLEMGHSRGNLELIPPPSESELPSAVDPDHYKFGNAEVIEITRHLGFPEGNVIKYVARAGRKGNRVEDLRKARKYLDWAIENADAAYAHAHAYMHIEKESK